MKIRKIACGQFAGLINRELSFTDGLNLVIGANESGKSTLAELICQMFFRSVKLDRRRDAAFLETAFPQKADGTTPDFIDGELVFETEDGAYRLKKEWNGGKGSVRLYLPDGSALSSEETISERLSGMLGFGEGVYSELIFTSQKRRALAVESILRAASKKADALSDTKNALRSVLTVAAMETGGVSTELLEARIAAKLKELGSHWDAVAELPEGGARRGLANPWQKEVGTVLAAYYEAERIRQKQADAEAAERDLEDCLEMLSALETGLSQKEEERERFGKYAGTLGQVGLLQKALTERKAEIQELGDVLLGWPQTAQRFQEASSLRERLEAAQLHEEYLTARAAMDARQCAEEKLKTLPAVSQEELRTLRQKEKQRDGIRSRLAGLRVSLKIRQMGNTPVELRSLLDESPIGAGSGDYVITEAAQVTVPGILEMELAPAGVDADALKQELAEISTSIEKALQIYQVSNAEELAELAEARRAAEQECETCEKALERALSLHDFETLAKAEAGLEYPVESAAGMPVKAKAEIYAEASGTAYPKADRSVLTSIESSAELRRQAAALCGGKSIDAYLGALEQMLLDNTRKYGSDSMLKEKISATETEIDEITEKLKVTNEIPDEFKTVRDPDAFRKELQTEINALKQRISDANSRRIEAEKKTDEKGSGEYAAELEEQLRILGEKQEEYRRWQHIQEVFYETKAQMAGSPMAGLEANFNRYLGLISEGRMRLSSIDDSLTVQLASGTGAMSYGILSDGAKDTVSLAFRLAMLDELFPDGGGLAVFDDPFTDMDPARVRQSCRLLEEFAKRNQVIFVSCDDKYEALLHGSVQYL